MPYQSTSGYQFYRNVMAFGAVGDGVHDDTVAINLAVTTGNRCGLPENCGSTTISGVRRSHHQTICTLIDED
jgi:glucan 1,3-beta-glucosidase